MFDEFKEQLFEILDREYPNGYIYPEIVPKLNGEKVGIKILCEGCASPVLYMENLYQKYLEDGMNSVYELIKQATGMFASDEVVEWLKWENARKYLKPFVMNWEKNKECIVKGDKIAKPMLDLILSCYLRIKYKSQIASIQVTNKLLEAWEVSEEEVYEQAYCNEEYEIKPIGEILDSETLTDGWLLTNKERIRGAAGMFSKQYLSQLAEQCNSDLYILPSSIHEVIILKSEKCTYGVEHMKSVIDTVNEYMLSDEEFLSDSVYYYDRKKQELDIVK